MFFTERLKKNLSLESETSGIHLPFISTFWIVLKTYHWSFHTQSNYKLQCKKLNEQSIGSMEKRIQTLYVGRYSQNEAITRSSHQLPRGNIGFMSLFSA